MNEDQVAVLARLKDAWAKARMTRPIRVGRRTQQTIFDAPNDHELEGKLIGTLFAQEDARFVVEAVNAAPMLFEIVMRYRSALLRCSALRCHRRADEKPLDSMNDGPDCGTCPPCGARKALSE